MAYTHSRIGKGKEKKMRKKKRKKMFGRFNIYTHIQTYK